MILAVKRYKLSTLDADRAQTRYVIDVLFTALRQYYQANCRIHYDYTTGTALTPGTLDPANNPSQNKLINITTDLVTPGYLTTGWPPADVPYIDTTAGNYGFIVQFSLATMNNRGTVSTLPIPAATSEPTAIYNNWWVSGGPNNVPTWTTAATFNTPIQPNNVVGQVYVWREIVAIKVKASSAPPAPVSGGGTSGSSAPSSGDINAYKMALGADCVSDLSGNTIVPCDQSPPANGTYLVWMRLPSYSTTANDTLSDTWTSMQGLRGLNNSQYNDDMYGAAYSSTGAPEYTSNNYLCGG